ncbi:hypothetical protein CCH79_00010448 [Gambusia affinis]|uniref:Uncharacterized protein n=1 Tax=Gambusia affinis TaxID=33528 RepID=A0A315V120_GAMAF|nr:hypothetical protein CCH79_00010448 [Gambusia affinis]
MSLQDSEFMVQRNSVSPPFSSSSMGTNCSTCLSPACVRFSPMSPSPPISCWMLLCTSLRTGSIGAAASGQKPTHVSKAPTPPDGGGHLKEMERKQACRQNTAAAVTRVRAENTRSSRASPALRVCRASRTHPSSCCWYRGSPSCSRMQPL